MYWVYFVYIKRRLISVKWVFDSLEDLSGFVSGFFVFVYGFYFCIVVCERGRAGSKKQQAGWNVS